MSYTLHQGDALGVYCGANHYFDAFGVFDDVSFPETKYGITASDHVGILGLVEFSSAFLPGIKTGEARGVAMPVVAIKLNDKIGGWYKGINAKFSANYILRLMDDAHLVKYFVTTLLCFVWKFPLLLCDHFSHVFFEVGMCVTAFIRAILSGPSFLERRGVFEGPSAVFTDVRCLVASLPQISMFGAAEVGPGCVQSIAREVKRHTAPIADNIGPGLGLCWVKT